MSMGFSSSVHVDDENVPSCAPLERSKDKGCSWAAQEEQGRETEEDGYLDEGGSYERHSSVSDDGMYIE